MQETDEKMIAGLSHAQKVPKIGGVSGPHCACSETRRELSALTVLRYNLHGNRQGRQAALNIVSGDKGKREEVRRRGERICTSRERQEARVIVSNHQKGSEGLVLFGQGIMAVDQPFVAQLGSYVMPTLHNDPY